LIQQEAVGLAAELVQCGEEQDGVAKIKAVGGVLAIGESRLVDGGFERDGQTPNLAWRQRR
jgi:hypothetical protein